MNRALAAAAAPAGMLLAASIALWALLAWLAFDMGHPLAQLTMPPDADWSAANVAAIFVMWAVMMAAMMLPSALPMIVTFVRLNTRQGEPLRAWMFVAAYVLVWTGFSAAATALQWGLHRAEWIDSMLVSTSASVDAALLLVAGAYQFSPAKRVCLAQCRTPQGFLLGEWRAGASGAFAMGVRHGLLCVGCCWALMGLLFVGGAMNLGWVAAIAVAVAIEKMAPGGPRVGHALGMLLIAAGLARLAGTGVWGP